MPIIFVYSPRSVNIDAINILFKLLDTNICRKEINREKILVGQGWESRAIHNKDN